MAYKKVTFIYIKENEETILKEIGKVGIFELKEIEEGHTGLEKGPQRRGKYRSDMEKLTLGHG